MDLATSPKTYLPKANTTAGGLLRAMWLLFIAFAAASVVGGVSVWLLKQLWSATPVFVGVIIGLFALVFILSAIMKRHQWIAPWYYLLPAIVFLLTFTIFPLVLTVILGFTNYAGTRNGKLNVSSKTALTAVTGNTLTLENSASLQCDKLLTLKESQEAEAGQAITGCEGVRALVYASSSFVTQNAQLEENTLILDPPPPAGRLVQIARLNLPDLGFAQDINVVDQQGGRLVLERPPAFPPDLSEVVLELDPEGIPRTIVGLDGNALTLDTPLPEDKTYVAIARFNDFKLVGMDNFRIIAQQAQRALLPVFAWNLSFAFLTIIINTICGVFIALLLNNPNLQFRNLYRTLLIVPWALPAIITIQVWKGFFNTNFGAINRLLALLDLPVLDWLGGCFEAKVAILVMNLWLGLPFMVTATLGALSAIPNDIYEAARIDGANRWRSFWGVTAPLLSTALIPITLTGFAFNFNNFNVVFLLTDGGPPASWGTSTARCTDILLSWAYNEAFRNQGGFAYGLGSAISLMIFILTVAISLVNFRVTGVFKEARNT